MAFVFMGVLVFKGNSKKEFTRKEITLVQSEIKASRRPTQKLPKTKFKTEIKKEVIRQWAPETSLAITENEYGQRIIVDDIIVSLLKGSPIEEVSKIERNYSLVIHSYDSESGIAHFKIPPFTPLPSEQLRKKIQAENIIVIASEPNYVVRLDSHPSEFNTFTSNQLWYLDNTGQDLPFCLEKEQSQTCTPPEAKKSIDVSAGNFESLWKAQYPCALTAVIDTGFDLEHPDLKNRLWTNSSEIPNNDIDDDTNGYVDDTMGTSASYNFKGLPIIPLVQSRAFSYTSSNDLQNIVDKIKKLNDDTKNKVPGALETLKKIHSKLIHGTAVAALIAAEGNNGVGGVGLCASGQLMPVQAARLDLDSNNAPTVIANTLYIANAIRYAAKNGAKVINVSMGELWKDQNNNPAPKSSCNVSAPCHLLEAIEYAHEQGAILVTSAGNDGLDTDTVPHYPSSLSYERPDLHVVSVGGHNADGSLGMAQEIDASNNPIIFFESNYGKNSVTVTAPSTYMLGLLMSQDLEKQFFQSYSRDNLFKEIYTTSSSYPAYSYGFGTSFSAPLVSAVLAMIYQRLLDKFPAAQNTNKDYAKTAKKVLLENIKPLSQVLSAPSASTISSMENKSQAGAALLDAKASLEAIDTLAALENPDPHPVYNVPDNTKESIFFKGCTP